MPQVFNHERLERGVDGLSLDGSREVLGEMKIVMKFKKPIFIVLAVWQD